MGLFEIFFIYAVSWWMILFMALPFGAAAAEKPTLTEYHAAPAKPNLKKKLLVTTLLAAVVTALLGWLIQSGVMTLWLPYRF